jgi:hypothetical protein
MMLHREKLLKSKNAREENWGISDTKIGENCLACI